MVYVRSCAILALQYSILNLSPKICKKIHNLATMRNFRFSVTSFSIQRCCFVPTYTSRLVLIEFLSDRLQNGSPHAIGPLSVCLCVCDVGVSWPNGWIDQDETLSPVQLLNLLNPVTSLLSYALFTGSK